MADRSQLPTQLGQKVAARGLSRPLAPPPREYPTWGVYRALAPQSRRLALLRLVLHRLLLSVLLAGAAGTAPARAEPVTQAQLAAALDQQRRECHAPGAVACVAEPGQAAVFAASGVASLATGRLVTTDDYFAIGSITKMFVAVTVLQLAAEGRLGLEDPLATYVPDFPRAKDITIRMLLQHRSGIGDPTRVFYFDGAGSPGRQALMSAWLIMALSQQWTPQQLTALIASAAPDAAPGAAGNYSNGNYILLGRVIQAVTGHQVSREIRERILQPLGMAHTVFAGEEPLPESDMQCYALRDGRYVDCRALENPSFAWTAGAMASTAPDLLVFIRALFTGELLAPPWQEQMLRFMPLTGFGGYGLGVTRRGAGADEAWGHTGRTVGFSSCVWYYPASGRIEIMLANLQRCDLSRLLQEQHRPEDAAD